MMQWSNFTKFSLSFNIDSPGIHTLLPSVMSVLQCLDSRGMEAVILLLEKSSLQIQGVWKTKTEDRASSLLLSGAYAGGGGGGGFGGSTPPPLAMSIVVVVVVFCSRKHPPLKNPAYAHASCVILFSKT